MEQRLPSRINTNVNNHLHVQQLLPEGVPVSIPDDIIRAAIREVREEYPGIFAFSPADRAESGHMGSTAGWPLPETTTSVGGPSNSQTNAHTIPVPPALVLAPHSTSQSARRPSSILLSPPAHRHPTLSSLAWAPQSVPTAWNVAPVYSSPTSSALDLASLSNPQPPLLHQQPATDRAPPAQALGYPATALPGPWSNHTPNDYDGFEPFLTSTDIEAFLQLDDNGART